MLCPFSVVLSPSLPHSRMGSAQRKSDFIASLESLRRSVCSSLELDHLGRGESGSSARKRRETREKKGNANANEKMRDRWERPAYEKARTGERNLQHQANTVCCAVLSYSQLDVHCLLPRVRSVAHILCLCTE